MLLYFILGIAFYGLVIPIAESIISLFCSYIEYLKGKIQVKMLKLQKEIEADDKEPIYAIGFDTSCGITLEDDDEEWEDDE